MKKKIGYLFLIIISVLGSKLIFGKDYHLNSDNLVDTNLYLYDIFNKNDVTLTMVDNENLYYILNGGNNSKMHYTLIKYNLISNKVINEYTFDTNYALKDIKMFDEGGKLYLTAINSNVFYVFNKNLELVNEKFTSNNYDSYGILNGSFITTVNNQIFKNESLYTTLPNSCGKVVEVIYSKDTFLHFHNNDTGFGCLYNINTKKREYLDYKDVSLVNDRLLEYQDNRLSFKYNGDSFYFNDINESNNLRMHVNGDYLFTIDVSNNLLKIYNLETDKIIYERGLIELNKAKISNILIDDYAYFTIVKDGVAKLYIWDYLKESRINKNMISYNEKEYKFKNNELKEEIKNKYNIDVYIYDQAVKYFEDVYVIPSYDDILINSRLQILKDVLEISRINELSNHNKLIICLEKDIISNNSIENPKAMVRSNDSETILAINITNDDFKNVLIEKISIFNPNINSISGLNNK